MQEDLVDELSVGNVFDRVLLEEDKVPSIPKVLSSVYVSCLLFIDLRLALCTLENLSG